MGVGGCGVDGVRSVKRVNGASASLWAWYRGQEGAAGAGAKPRIDRPQVRRLVPERASTLRQGGLGTRWYPVLLLLLCNIP